uniref:TonB-dependent receptor n=2 Tax=unclassified Prevotella TaxID=2638335 RepID=A0AB33IYR4_9BACT
MMLKLLISNTKNQDLMKSRIVLCGIFMLTMGFLPFSATSASPGPNYINVADKKVDVYGTVVDEMGPVVGATVRVVGAKSGTVTNVQGEFHLTVALKSKIEISCVGYLSQTVVVKDNSPIRIQLREDAVSLGDVQVIAYGTTRKVTVTGALSSVNQKELLKSPVASMTNALAGKVPGLSSIQESGQPGADESSLLVRGVGSMNAELSRPLILVDGVERSFSQIDPNEVEDITVLKDASATAVFGVRGANGVILVTTKRGTNQAPKINFSTSVACQIPSRIPEFANSYEWASEYNKAQLHDGVSKDMLLFNDDDLEKFRTHSSPLTHPDVNWTDMLVRKSALQTQHNINVSGGAEKIKYFASLSVFTQEGLFKVFKNRNDRGFNYERYNYRMNLDISLTKTTSLQLNLGGYFGNRQEPNYNNGANTSLAMMFRDIYAAVPFAGAGIVDGKHIRMNSSQFAISNIHDGLKYYGTGYNTTLNNVMNFDAQITQKLDFLTKGLTFHLKGAYNSGVVVYKRHEGYEALYEPVTDENGNLALRIVNNYARTYLQESNSHSKDWYLEGALNYKRDFGDHHVSGLAMYNQTMKYYPTGYFEGIPRGYIGFVGRGTYDYKTKYLLDVSVGYNGSENFAKGHRFGLFPAGSIGWILSEEDFFKSLKSTIGYMKLRASYGKVGNDITSDNSRFLYLPDSYNISTGSYSFGTTTNTNITGASEGKVGNPNVTWETSVKQNYGLDLKLFKEKLGLNFDYFIEHRENILISRGTVPLYLAINLPVMNLGKVDNHGYELSLRWQDKFKDFSYYIGGNLSYAKNKIVFMDETKFPYEWMQQTGKSVGQGFGYVFDGYFTEEEVANYATLKGQPGGIPDQGSGYIPLAGDVKYKDLNGDGRIDNNDECSIGNPTYPIYTMGMNMGFSWRGFDFSMTFSGAFKTSRLLYDIYRLPFGESRNFSLMKYMITDAWTPEKGNSAKAPALSLRNQTHNYQGSDLWMRNASYLRLKNIELGYSFPKNIIQSLRISSLRMSLSGYNLLTFDKLKVSDPEANPMGHTYPLIKVVNFGLRVGF